MADQNKFIPKTDDLCLTKVDSRRCTFLWTIQKYFSVHNLRARVLKSSPFGASGDEFKWQLHLNPYCNDSHISLCLYPAEASKDFSEHSPITGKLKFAIMNAKNEETCIRREKFTLMHPGELHAGFNYFVSKDKLFDEKRNLVPKDTLTIFCDVLYTKETDIVNISAKPFSKSLEQREPACLTDEDLLMNEEFSDVTLIIKGEKFPAHKSILVARSLYFRTAFTIDMMEKQSNCIEIQDINIPEFKEMLRYIYTGKVQNLQEIAPELLAAADEYGLENLKVMCEEELYEKLSLETALNTLVLADKYHAGNLKKEALVFIKTHSYISNILDEEARKSLVKFPHLLLEIIDTFSDRSPM